MHVCLASAYRPGQRVLTRAHWTTAALLCCCIWQAAGCRKAAQASPDIVIEHEIAPWPPRFGPAVITLTLSERGGRAVRGAQVSLEADMSHAGMRPEFAPAREIAVGRYQGGLNFTMAGDWVIIARVTLPGGQKLERQMEVHGVR